MSAFQITSIIGVPLAVLFVTIVLLAFARPDRDEDNGVYAAYLAIASVFSLYLGLLALAALGEAITQYLVIGTDPSNGELANPVAGRAALNHVVGGNGAESIAAFAALAGLMAIAYAYHARRRSELIASETTSPTVANVDRAYRAGACFAMLSLITIGAVIAGASGYDFFSQPVGSTAQLRDFAMGSLVTYGGLVLLAGAVFRLNVWGIRSVGPRHSVVDEHGAVVAVFRDLAGFGFGREGIGRVDEHHRDAVTFAPVERLDCHSVGHGQFLHHHQRFGIRFRSLSGLSRPTHHLVGDRR